MEGFHDVVMRRQNCQYCEVGSWKTILHYYRPQGKVMFSEACVSYSVHKGRNLLLDRDFPTDRDSPGTLTSSGGYCIGRHAFYWNVFFFFFLKIVFIWNVFLTEYNTSKEISRDFLHLMWLHNYSAITDDVSQICLLNFQTFRFFRSKMFYMYLLWCWTSFWWLERFLLL